MSHSFIRVARSTEWEMAHLLRDHPGKCRFLHGHSYKLTVEVGGYIQKGGMVTDFGDLKKLLKSSVEEVFDHALVVDEKTAGELPNAFKAEHTEMIVMEQPPTCENLLISIKNILQHHLPEEVNLQMLTLQETSGSYARWLKEDN